MKRGFTLAEILITLGIIGVVAAMTIPTLINKIQKRTIEAQIKENYAMLAQTMRFAEYDDVESMPITANSTASMKKWFEQFLAPHLKVEQVCFQTAGCWHKSGVVKTLNSGTPAYETKVGEDESTIGWATMTFKTAKGAYFNMDGSSSGTTSNLFGVDSKVSTLQFYFDVNGDRRPNIIGKDIYIMVYDPDKGFIPAGNDRSLEQIKQNCEQGNGYWCLTYVKNNGWVIPESVWKRKI